MRRLTDYVDLPDQPRTAAWSGTPIAAAADPIPTPKNPIPTPTDPIPTPTNPIPTPKNPIPTPTDPIPTPANPIPTPANPIPTPKYPIPAPKDPIPTPVNPISPASPPSPGVPVAPEPQPAPSGGNLPVTAAQIAAADNAVNGAAARSGGLTGAGIKVGIISNSFDVLGGAAANVAAGLLPADGVTVLSEGPAGSDDEGRAMAELVHATAPGAQLYFASAAFSESGFAAAIAALQAAGCQVIVDDVGYSDEPMFQNAGPIDTAVTAAVSGGVNYFAAAGNDNDAAYQAAVAPQFVSIAGIGTEWAQTFAGGATTQSVFVQAGFPTELSLEWDAPFDAGNADTIEVVALSGGNVVAVSGQVANEPALTLDFPIADTDTTYQIAILYSSGTGQPGTIKYEMFGGQGFILTPDGGEPTGAVYGHTMLPGVNAVGAVNVADTPAQGGALQSEYFSSSGGSAFLFAPDGTRLPAPQPSGAPEFAAPDGADTSIFQPFDGTSAAAPVAAATAALMLQANGALSNADITTLLEDSALPVASADDAAGAGLIQADLATRFASTGVIAGSPQTVIHGTAACTIQGGAGSHWLVAGSGGTLLQSQGDDSVQAGAGADTVDLTGSAAVLYGSTGSTWVRMMNGQDTIVGGSGALTVTGGAGGGVIYGSTSGGNQLVAGAQQTIILSLGTNDFVAGSGDGDLLYASNQGDDTVVGGSGTEILVGGTAGGGGPDVFLAGNGSPLVAPEAATAVVAFGTGNATALLGTGNALLHVAAGQAGGLDSIYDFDASRDLLQLGGFTSDEAASVVAQQYDTGGNSWLKLPDGTVLVFVGLDHLSASSVAFG